MRIAIGKPNEFIIFFSPVDSEEDVQSSVLISTLQADAHYINFHPYVTPHLILCLLKTLVKHQIHLQIIGISFINDCPVDSDTTIHVTKPIIDYIRCYYIKLEDLECSRIHIDISALCASQMRLHRLVLRKCIRTIDDIQPFISNKSLLRISHLLDVSDNSIISKLSSLQPLINNIIIGGEFKITQCELNRAPHLMNELATWLQDPDFNHLSKIDIGHNYFVKSTKQQLAPLMLTSRNELVIIGLSGAPLESFLPAASNIYPPWTYARAWAAKEQMFHNSKIGRLITYWILTQRPLPIPRHVLNKYDKLQLKVLLNPKQKNKHWISTIEGRINLVHVKDKSYLFRALPVELVRHLVTFL
jgi:hypothetical protein